MNGKGDKRRPQGVDDKTMQDNWDRTFSDPDTESKLVKVGDNVWKTPTPPDKNDFSWLKFDGAKLTTPGAVTMTTRRPGDSSNPLVCTLSEE